MVPRLCCICICICTIYAVYVYVPYIERSRDDQPLPVRMLCCRACAICSTCIVVPPERGLNQNIYVSWLTKQTSHHSHLSFAAGKEKKRCSQKPQRIDTCVAWTTSFCGSSFPLTGFCRLPLWPSGPILHFNQARQPHRGHTGGGGGFTPILRCLLHLSRCETATVDNGR